MKRALINVHKFGLTGEGKTAGNHIINETSKRVRLLPQKETTPEYVAFHRFKQKMEMKHEAET